MCMNALPTFVNLQRKGVNICDICPACGMEPESNLHVFVKCEVAKRVWRCWVDSLADLLNVNMDIIDIAMEIFESGTSSDLEVFFGVAWAIWYNRNKIVYESSSQVPDYIWGFAKKYILKFKSASIACSQSLSRSEGKWIVPLPGVFKINVDGAAFENDRNSSVGVVIRDAAGNVHAACCKYLQGQYLVEEVEVLAMECAVTSVIAAETSGCLGHVFQGIRSLLSSFSSWKIKHMKKEYNRAAHELAQYARQKEESHVWKGVCPPMVIHVIQEDGI
ncbi:uncharacterized protein LOC115981107 [Quercus lobata]|uniref:uncharacterized protein LOC115981107 n=1 Tax=Quercus lobata TaxID=97700 RepID=UPI00124747B9|nr:uncharacterized protein LOC115981107 [Quercus lobata]